MKWPYAHVRDNFIDICDRLEIGYEAALDIDFEWAHLSPRDREDLFFGIGYVRGIADAWDVTALTIVEEIIHEEGQA